MKPAPTAGVPGTLRAGATAVVLLALALAEVAVIPQPLHPVTISPFFTQLAAQPGDFGILELPVTTHYLRDHARMLNETVSGKPIIGGYISRQVRDPYLTADSPFYPFIKLAPRPPPDILPPLSPFAVLNYYHIPYIVVYKNDESYVQPSDRAAVDAYVQALYPTGVGVVYDDAQLTAYRVPTIPADAPLLWAGDGWYAPETQHGQTWRWSNGRQADLHVLSPIPLTWPLRFRAASFHSPARLTITLNGHALQTVELGADLAAYDLGALTLPPGETVINFTSDAPPGATTGRDARPLGFTLRDLTTPGVRVIVLQRGGGRT